MIVTLKPSSEISLDDEFSPRQNQKYLVYGITFPSNIDAMKTAGIHRSIWQGSNYYLILNGDTTLFHPFSASEFDIVENTIPDDWKAGQYGNPTAPMLFVGYEGIGDAGHEERIIDGEPEDVARLDKVRQKYEKRWGELLR